MDQQSTKLYLPVTEAIKYAWHTVWSNLWFFAGTSFVLIIIEIFVPSIIKSIVDSLLGVPAGSNLMMPLVTHTSAPALIAALILDLADIVVVAITAIYFTRISLLFVEGQKPSFDQIFNYPIANVGLKLLGGLILLYVSLFGVPAVLLTIELALATSNPPLSAIVSLITFAWIIASIYFAIKYSLFNYPIIDRQEKVFHAFKLSAAMTHKTKLRLIGLGLLLVLINLVGILCLLIGVLVTIPMTSLAISYAYRKLLTQVERGNTQAPLNPKVNQEAPVQAAS